MAKYPQVQEKVQKEIDTALENHRVPALSDRNELPYTDSVINEVLRFGAIVPVIAHRNICPVKFRNFDIPENTITFGNLFGLFRDSKVWKDANHFNPEVNFPIGSKNSDKSELSKCVEMQLIPFGIGKRICPGEILARQELFLFFTELMRKFSVCADSEWPLPSEFEGTLGITRGPLPFRLRFIQRN